MKLRKRRSVSGQYAESSNSDPDYVDEDVKEKTPKRIKQQKARSSKKTKRGRERKADSKESVTDDSSSESSSESVDYSEKTPNHKQKKQKRKRSTSKKDKRARKYHSDDEDDSSEATVDNDRSDNDGVSDNVTSILVLLITYIYYILNTVIVFTHRRRADHQFDAQRGSALRRRRKGHVKYRIVRRDGPITRRAVVLGINILALCISLEDWLMTSLECTCYLFSEKICLSFFVIVAGCQFDCSVY